MANHIAIWAICALTTAAILIRPWNRSEAIWAVSAAVLLAVSSLLPWRRALAAASEGTDVYLFLVGMMLLAELARAEGLFDWLAALAARAARGSAARLFVLVYLVGTLVTILLSNDATAVVLTPAVYAAARSARAEPLPYLYVCAFIANAASFVLPISNPANLVVFVGQVPPLPLWLARFALPSLASIVATFVALRWSQRAALAGTLVAQAPRHPLSPEARLAACGIVLTATALLAANATHRPLGPPTLIAAAATVTLVMLRGRRSPWPLLRSVHWAVLPLVAGLFVMVEALDRTGVLRAASALLQSYRHGAIAAWLGGISAGLASNALNNLPVALIAHSVLTGAPNEPRLGTALLIGVDLGPNLAVTGSLATILWLSVLRREGQRISGLRFLRLGLIVMPPALLLALAAALVG